MVSSPKDNEQETEVLAALSAGEPVTGEPEYSDPIETEANAAEVEPVALDQAEAADEAVVAESEDVEPKVAEVDAALPISAPIAGGVADVESVEPAAPPEVVAAPVANPEPAPESLLANAREPLTRAEAVEQATRQWQERLSAMGGASALRDIDLLADATLDLSAAHPGGMAQFLAGRSTILGNLVREPSSLAHARRRAKVVIARAAEHHLKYGVTATTAALGVAAWYEVAGRPVPPPADVTDSGNLTPASATFDGAGQAEGSASSGDSATLSTAESAAVELSTAELGEVSDAESAATLVRAPVFLRPVTIETHEGDLEPTLTLRSRVVINPVVERALLRAGVDVATLMTPAVEGSSDLRQALDSIRDAASVALPGVEVTELIVVGSFAHPGQVLADDLAGGWIGQSDLVAALADDAQAREALDLPLPPFLQGDRDPSTERGVGDLDASQHRVLDTVASGISVVVDAPPGSPTTETVAAIVADAAASGRSVLHLPGTRRAAETLLQQAQELGIGDMVLDASAGSTQGAEVGEAITTRLGAEPPEVDVAKVSASRTDLARLHTALVARVRAWHTVRSEWGVSAHGAMQALADLTAARPAPRNTVRLNAATLARLSGREREVAKGELAKAATLGAFQLRRSDSPWFGVRLADAEQARTVVDQVQRLAVRTLPALRQKIAVATAQTGLEPAPTLAVWTEQLRMLEGVRRALDVFQPAIFERSAADLVAATSHRGDRGDYENMPASVRRRLRKQAKDLLRPGRHVTDLHAELVQVQEQREIWRMHCPAGGWPQLPESMTELASMTDEVVAALAGLDPHVRPTLGDGAAPLETVAFDRLGDHLLALAHDESVSRALPERTDAVAKLEDYGLNDLLGDLSIRRVPMSLVTAELDLAWWSSVLEEILSSDPALRGSGSFAADTQAWRELDRKQVASLVGPVTRAAATHLRTLAVAHKESAREVFREADAARRGLKQLDLRTLRHTHSPVAAAVLPCWSVPPMLVPQVLDPSDRVDLLVLDNVQNLSLEQAIGAIARADQVVLVGDVHRGGTGIVADLAAVLPQLQLDGNRSDRDEHLSAFLAEHGYADAVVCVPAPPGPSKIRLDLVEGRGMAAHGGVVETVAAEVDHVVDLVIDHALTRSDESLAVIALNARHAMRIRDAVTSAVSGSAAVSDYFASAKSEPFTVVDVESAAGLRRDAVILAVGYGKTPHGRVIHQFGAVSSPRGVSLLVDAIEACRSRLVVTSCIAPSELDLDRLRSGGSRMLADLLSFASTGGEPVTEPAAREGDPDPLLVDLADRLWRMGLTVVARYGPVDGVQIPLAVGHPSLAGELGVAILTDSAEYVATRSLRVRDRYWVERLERRGWDVLTLASIDVFLDPEAAARQVLDAVSARVRRNLESAPQVVEQGQVPVVLDVEDAEDEALVTPTLQAKRAERPDVFPGLPIGAYSPRELDALLAWIASDGTVRDEDELTAALNDELAIRRPSPRSAEVVAEVVQRFVAPNAAVVEALVVEEPETEPSDRGSSATAKEIVETLEGLTEQEVPTAVEESAAPSEIKPPVLPTRAWEDDDRAWGDRGSDGDDERFLREKPPHWS